MIRVRYKLIDYSMAILITGFGKKSNAINPQGSETISS